MILENLRNQPLNKILKNHNYMICLGISASRQQPLKKRMKPVSEISVIFQKLKFKMMMILSLKSIGLKKRRKPSKNQNQ